jgi:hypothetical protein
MTNITFHILRIILVMNISKLKTVFAVDDEIFENCTWIAMKYSIVQA